MKITSILQLLVLAVGFTISLLVFRIFYSGSLMYIFFVWNLFLAAMPLGISSLLVQTKGKGIQWLLFTAWLLFFPNALYIVTDLVHLTDRHPVPFWFDMILVFSAAINGLIMAYASLQQVELFLGTKFNKQKTGFILSGCFFLGSFGVYIGRFLRWNSWDVLLNPFGLMSEIVQHIINPFQHSRTWGMTIILTVFFSIFYFTIKKLPSLIIKTSE
jgi:uncharacterized membrane protein